MLVNNAGIGAITPLLNSEIEKMEEMITLNMPPPGLLIFNLSDSMESHTSRSPVVRVMWLHQR